MTTPGFASFLWGEVPGRPVVPPAGPQGATL